MIPPGIQFDVAAPAVAPDPNRTDIALVVGLLPLAAGGEPARQAVADGLSDWGARADATLTDVPVRVRSLAEAEALFDLGGRLDRVASVRGVALPVVVDIPEADTVFTVNVDGVDQSVTFAAGPMDRAAVVNELDTKLTAVNFSLSEGDPSGRAGLVATRTSDGAGGITMYANPTLGFDVAARDATGVTGCPTGATLRAFFAMGGAEAVIIRMGDPAPLFGVEADRVAALQALIPGFGAGAIVLADLTTLPQLPGHYPTRTPWRGLAHLHGLQDVAQVLMPDLPDLVSTVPAVAAAPAANVRPPARFQPCAPQPPTTFDGQAEAGEPARADLVGLALWSRLASWAVQQTARITPEAMVVLGTPLPADGKPESMAALATAPELSHPQLQLVGPWAVSPLFGDMPGSAAPGDGLVAGAIAAKALAEGAWRTVAGTPLPEVAGLLGDSPRLTTATAPTLSLLGRGVSGFQILSDRTMDPIEYAQANTRRLMGLILRAARHRGEGMVFEPNGEVLWRDTRHVLVTLLRRLHSVGALSGGSEDQAFTVTCGPDTMTQADIDAGRVIAEVGFRPAQSLELIRIVIENRGGQLSAGVAA